MSETFPIPPEEPTEEIPNEEGGVDIMFGDILLDDFLNEEPYEHFANLAERMNDETLEEIQKDVVAAFTTDCNSRSEWEDITVEALDNLGIEYLETSEPFDGACTATHPLILENSIKFQSKASNELLPSSGPVRTKIIGEKTEEVEQRAKRVRDDMNYVVQHGIPEYAEETDRALFFMAFIGNAFKRKAWDPDLSRITDEFVLPDRLVVNNNAKSLAAAERISFKDYIPRRRLENLMDLGFYRQMDIADTNVDEPDSLPQPYAPQWTEFEQRIREIQGISTGQEAYNDVYEVIEQQCYLKLDENDLNLDEFARARPYIVSFERTTGKILSIYRNWDASDEKNLRLDWVSHYNFVPNAGFYGWGYTHLLGNLQRTITLAMRSLADAGQFANLPGGFKAEDARINDDGTPVGFGEFKNIELPPTITDVRQAFMPLPFREPSQVLFALMQELQATGQKFADSTEQVIADSTNYGPVGTTMALLEASTRFFASVYRRAYRGQAHEFKIVSRLVFDYYPKEYPYVVDSEQTYSRSEDYDPDTIDILPVATPNYSSQAQRISKAQLVLQTAQTMPDMHDRREALREFYKAFEIEQLDKLVPPEQQPQPQDPLSDILTVLKGGPIQAFPEQDHKSHIQVKAAWLTDPENGASELMAAAKPIILANIQEHQFMKYSAEMQALQAREQLSMEQAAQRIARLNQIAKEEENEGSPEMLLAQAEMLRAATADSKEKRESRQDEFKLGIDAIEAAAKIEEAASRAADSGRKMNLDIAKVGADLLKASSKEVTEGIKVDAQKSPEKDE